jgi:hypothetical protein
MKYVAIIDNEGELSEESIEKIKNTIFVGNEDSQYCFDITSIKEAPRKISNYVIGNFQEGYNSALIDCGVIEDEKR